MAKNLKVTPLHDRVIVKPAAAEEKSAGGIIIPDTAKEKPQRGTVIAAGPGKTTSTVLWLGAHTRKRTPALDTTSAPTGKRLSSSPVTLYRRGVVFVVSEDSLYLTGAHLNRNSWS